MCSGVKLTWGSENDNAMLGDQGYERLMEVEIYVVNDLV